MKFKLLLGSLLIAASSLLAQRVTVSPIFPGGGSITTTNSPSAGYVLYSDGSVYYWGPVVATSTNPVPSYVITNQQSITALWTNKSAVRFEGTVTNVGQVYFQDTAIFNGSPNSIFASANVNQNISRVTNNAILLYLDSNSLPRITTGGVVTNQYRHYFVDTNMSLALSNIIASASYGDVVELGVGSFNIQTNTLVIPHGVSLIGQGELNTYIIGGGTLYTNGPVIVPGSDSRVAYLSIVLTNAGTNWQAGYGFVQDATFPVNYRGATNCLLENFRILGGQSDGAFMYASNYHSGIIRNGIIESKWDGVVVGSAMANSSNNWVMNNVKVTCDLKGATFISAVNTATARPIRATFGTLHLFNCDITATNANISLAVAVQTTNTSIYIHGGSYRAAGTNTSKLCRTLDSNDDPTGGHIYVEGVGITDNDFQGNGTYYDYSVVNLFASGLVVFQTNLTVGGDLAVTTGTISGKHIEATDTLAMGLVTGSRVAMFDGANQLTNVAAGGAGEFLKPDGTSAVPPGGGAANFNISQFSASTGFTNIKSGAMVTNIQAFNITNTGTFTNSGAADFGSTVSIDGGLVVLGALSEDSTALITSLTEDASPTAGDYIMTYDDGSGKLRKVSRANFDSGTATAGTNYSAGHTNSTHFAIVQNGTNATGAIKTVSAGSNVTLTEQGTTNLVIASTGGSGSPGGLVGMVQYNLDGAFAGATNLTWTNNTLFIGANRSAQANLQITNPASPSGAVIYVDGISGGNFARMSVGQSVVGSAPTTVTTNWDLGSGGIEIAELGYHPEYGNKFGMRFDAGRYLLVSNLVSINNSFTIVSNHVTSIGGGILYGTNQVWTVDTSLGFGYGLTLNSDLKSNVIYSIFLSNVVEDISWDAGLLWRDGKTVTTAPSCQNGLYLIKIMLDSRGTNAWLDMGPELELAADTGTGILFTTNAGVLTISFDTGFLPAGDGSSGAQVTNVLQFSGASTNLIIDLGLASTNHVVYKIGLLTNSHVVLSNATLRKYPAEVIWQQDTNGVRDILSLRSTDGLIQTNGTLFLDTNANAITKWVFGASYFTSNVVATCGPRDLLSVTTNLFVLGTRYTNGINRAWISASMTLSAAAAGTAKVTMYVERAGITNQLTVSAGPLAALVTVEPLVGLIGPREIYYFTDETSGSGATAAILATSCSKIEL